MYSEIIDVDIKEAEASSRPFSFHRKIKMLRATFAAALLTSEYGRRNHRVVVIKV